MSRRVETKLGGGAHVYVHNAYGASTLIMQPHIPARDACCEALSSPVGARRAALSSLSSLAAVIKGEGHSCTL